MAGVSGPGEGDVEERLDLARESGDAGVSVPLMSCRCDLTV